MIRAHGIIRNRGLLKMVNPDYSSPSLVEFLGRLGFDAVFLDCEHQFAALERIQDMVRAAHLSEMLAFVRPELTHPAILTRYLDTGVDGLVIPHIETPEEVRDVVEVARYARFRDFDQKYILAIVESSRGIANLSDIVRVEGLAGVMIGPADLSQEMGFAGQPQHPEVQKMIENAIPLIQSAGLMVGLPIDSPSFAQHCRGGGCIVAVHAYQLLAEAGNEYIKRITIAK